MFYFAPVKSLRCRLEIENPRTETPLSVTSPLHSGNSKYHNGELYRLTKIAKTVELSTQSIGAGSVF